jgi:DNA (cytosine-5)-methyltransferase 1
MKVDVVELFAGVGGFRLGLEKASTAFQTVWSNQWEPGKTHQYAFDCYETHFGRSLENTNNDIAIDKLNCPAHDLLVGGFPCQDYSVARTQAKGIEGKKGVLWWDIRDIIQKRKPKYVLLENVDRLIRSPGSQRGRDFGIILRCLYDFGYAVEWRVVNAAEYGYAQRRRRTFIFACRRDTKHFKYLSTAESVDVFGKHGFFARTFRVKYADLHIAESDIKYSDTKKHEKYADLVDFSHKYHYDFLNSGYMVNGNVYTAMTEPIKCSPTPIKDILEKGTIDEKYFLGKNLDKWKYLKGAKKEPRVKPNGEPYFYTEGGMSFPDNLDLPSRTMLTSESSVNRSTHVVEDPKTKRLRLLTPIECERLNGFPDNWSNTGMPEKFRYFVMGNALVVPLITRMGKTIIKLINEDK